MLGGTRPFYPATPGILAHGTPWCTHGGRAQADRIHKMGPRSVGISEVAMGQPLALRRAFQIVGGQLGLDPMIRTLTAPSTGTAVRVAERRNRSGDLDVLAPVARAIARCPRSGRVRHGTAPSRPRDVWYRSERLPYCGKPRPRQASPLSLSGPPCASIGRVQLQTAHHIVRRHEAVRCRQSMVTSGVTVGNIHWGCARSTVKLARVDTEH